VIDIQHTRSSFGNILRTNRALEADFGCDPDGVRLSCPLFGHGHYHRYYFIIIAAAVQDLSPITFYE